MDLLKLDDVRNFHSGKVLVERYPHLVIHGPSKGWEGRPGISRSLGGSQAARQQKARREAGLA
jgi:hypothetical protein